MGANLPLESNSFQNYKSSVHLPSSIKFFPFNDILTIFPIQMHGPPMLTVVVRQGKYVVYSVYRFIGCIIDQSNWSGPFSLMVMMLDFYPGDRGLRPALAGCFIYRPIFLLLLPLVPGARLTTIGALGRRYVCGKIFESLKRK